MQTLFVPQNTFVVRHSPSWSFEFLLGSYCWLHFGARCSRLTLHLHSIILRSLITCLSEYENISLSLLSELPPLFVEGLRNKEEIEGREAIFQCQISKANAKTEWKKGHQTLKPDHKYKMRLQGVHAELVISNLDLKDSGNYTCLCGEEATTATLTVTGKNSQLLTVTSQSKSPFLWGVDFF